MTDAEIRAVIGVSLMFATILLIAWTLVSVFRVRWFRERILSADRGTRALGMLPIVAPVFVLFMILVRPYF